MGEGSLERERPVLRRKVDEHKGPPSIDSDAGQRDLRRREFLNALNALDPLLVINNKKKSALHC